MTKSEFKQIVEEGRKRGQNYLVVKIETQGNLCPEVIINGAENIPAKMAYYDKAYNDDLELIRAKESGTLIRITDVLMTNNLGSLTWFMY